MRVNLLSILLTCVAGLLVTAAVVLLAERGAVVIVSLGVAATVVTTLVIARQQSVVASLRGQLDAALDQLATARDKIESLSHTDELTQLANRRHFDETLENEWNRALREQRVLTLILIDLDFFKPYNDTYGLDQGDRCLGQVALSLRSCFTRSGDLVARYAAEEFAALLPGTELADNSLLEKCCRVVAEQNIAHSASEVADCVTISAGGCSLVPSDTLSAADLLKTASQALQRAKAEGRNRGVAFDFARGPGSGGVKV